MIKVEFEVTDHAYLALATIAERREQDVPGMIRGLLLALSASRPTTFEEEVIRLNREGMTVAWIASILGVPNNQVSNTLYKQGLRANPKKAGIR